MKGRGKSHVNCCRISIMMFTPVRLCSRRFSPGNSGPRGTPFENPLLPLVRDLDVLSPKLSASQVLPGGNSTGFVLVLDECNSPTTRHHTDLAEALETAKEVCESDSIAVVGKVLYEENLVWGEVLVGDDSGRGGTSWLETCTSCCL